MTAMTWDEKAQRAAEALDMETLEAAEPGEVRCGFREGARWQREALLADGAVERAARAMAAIQAVLDLHRRYGLYELEDFCTNTSDAHREERHHECSDDIGEFYCEDIPVGAVCDVCREDDGERAEWPCPTITAINETLGES